MPGIIEWPAVVKPRITHFPACTMDLFPTVADILGLPITRTREAQAGTVGMAMLCALATGQFSSFDEAAAALVHPGETYAPDGRFKAQYDERFEQYKRMYSASRAVYGRS